MVSPSPALKAWRTKRHDDIDRLLKTHKSITAGRPGRQWETEHMNFALITRLAAEFQGYCRDLHNEAADHVVMQSSIAHGQLNLLARGAYLDNRLLNSGNPSWETLSKDFKRFGMQLRPDLVRRYPQRWQTWHVTLEDLIEARNAIAHSNPKQIEDCRTKHQYGLTLRTAKAWRTKLNSITAGIDDVVGAHLKSLTGVRPW
jgi:hypothetical protein